MKKNKVVFSRYAESDLVEILDYFIAFNPAYAKQTLENIETKVQGLKDFPESGRVVPELALQNIMNYRELIEDVYRIIYSIEPEMIIIHSVIDSRRNLEDLLVRKFMKFTS